MPPHRINLLGASGSGASTLGRAVADALSLPYFDSDDYYHEPTDPPFQRQRAPQARHDLLVADLRRAPGWVLGGGVAGWTPYPQLDFTLIGFVQTPTDLRIDRLRRRERARFGDRILPGGDMHQTHEEFIAWAARYDAGDVEGKTRERHEAYLTAQACPVLRMDGAAPLRDLLQSVLHACGAR